MDTNNTHSVKNNESIIEIISDDSEDDDSISYHTTCLPKKSLQGHKDILGFTVSKNSGRIAIHEACSGKNLLVNFDLDSILNDSPSTQLSQSKIQRDQSKCPVISSPDINTDAVLKGVYLYHLIAFISSQRIFLSSVHDLMLHLCLHISLF